MHMQCIQHLLLEIVTHNIYVPRHQIFIILGSGEIKKYGYLYNWPI